MLLDSARDSAERSGIEQAGLLQQVQTLDPVPVDEHPSQFLRDTFRRDHFQFVGIFADRIPGFGGNLVVEMRGEADGAEQPQFILFEAVSGRADSADDAILEIRLPAESACEAGGGAGGMCCAL